MKTHIIALTVLVLSLASGLHAQQAEACRAALEEVIRKDGYVSLTAPAVSWGSSIKNRPSEAELIDRKARVARDWPDFLRRYTEPVTTTQSSMRRLLRSNVFWKEFFNGMTSDDIMRGVDTWTHPLLHAIAAQRKLIEMETDITLRARMISRLETAKADIEKWHENSLDSRRARTAMGGSIKGLIAPL
jgi:hypothetical protein